MPDQTPIGTDAAARSQAGAAGSSPSGPRIVIERPPPGLARGKYAWPAWGIGALGASVIAIALAYVVWRIVRSRWR